MSTPARVRRPVPLLLSILSIAACGTQPLGKPHRDPEIVGHTTAGQKLAYDLDLLFVIDNSLSMAPKQNNVRANFPVLMNELKNLPNGLPNVHIAVVTSDLGTGQVAGVSGCTRSYGDRGTFRYGPGYATGSTTPLSCSTIREGTFITALDKGARTNFDGDISDVFSCMAAVGENGCGFEQPLLAAAVALGYWNGGQLPVENAGFLREDALLGIILLTDEDDCSVPMDSTLFDDSQDGLATFGPQHSYRCNAFGHQCGGTRLPILAPDQTTPVAFNADECAPYEGENAALLPVGELASYIKGLKPRHPDRIFVAAIAGAPTSYTVTFGVAPRETTASPKVEPTCQNASDSAVTADPAIRIREFVRQFDDNGVMESVCADSFAPAMGRIAGVLKRKLTPGCLAARPTRALDCRVADHLRQENGAYVAQTVPRCNTDDVLSAEGTPTCWYLAENDQCTAAGLELKVNRGDHDIPAESYAVIECVGCVPGSEECL